MQVILRGKSQHEEVQSKGKYDECYYYEQKVEGRFKLCFHAAVTVSP
jgi:hypothetical protein